MLAAFLARRRAFRERVQREADALVIWVGATSAYVEARRLVRTHRAMGDRQSERLWAKVAVEITKQAGYKIRIEEDHWWLKLKPRVRLVGSKRRAIEDALKDLSQGVDDLAAGRAHEATLHNIEARLSQATGHIDSTPDIMDAAFEFCAACREIKEARDDLVEARQKGELHQAVASAYQELDLLRALMIGRPPQKRSD